MRTPKATPSTRTPESRNASKSRRDRRTSTLWLAFLLGCGASAGGGGYPYAERASEAEESPSYEAADQGGAMPASAPIATGATTADVDSYRAQAMPVSAEESDREPSDAAAAQTWRRTSNAVRFASVDLGGGQKLELRKVRVSVQVEGLRARTVIDHVFFNPFDRALEGTFRYPLPPEASISSYAMFLGQGTASPDFFGPDVQLPATASFDQRLQQIDPQQWGELRLGRLVRSERGREVYEQVTRQRVDPALVEEVAPNTFEARVFPIQARGFHRVIVSYEQTLPRVGSEREYLFPIPEGDLESFDFELSTDEPRARYEGDLRGVEGRRGLFVAHTEGALQAGTLAFRMPVERGAVEMLVGTHPERNERHFVARVHGTAGGNATSAASQAVFLLDTSLSEHPDRFALDVALMKGILERSPQLRRFAVVTFDAGARWLTRDWMTNDADGREAALEALDGVLLEGATDLGAALDTLATPPMPGQGALDVFLLSDGALSWGERDADTLVRRFAARSPWQARFFAYRTGLGAENLELLRRLASSGGVFNCLSRSSLAGCATAHQQTGFFVERARLVDAQGTELGREVLIAGGAATLAEAGELLVAGRIERGDEGVLVLEGTRHGAPHVERHPVSLASRGELASRAWAEIAVAHLLAANDPSLEELAVALGQHYRVPSRVTSFLVLETDAEYEQYDLEGERREAGAAIDALVHDARRQRTGARTSYERLMRALAMGTSHHHLAPETRDALANIASHEPVDFLGGRQSIPLVREGDASRSYRRGLSSEADVEHFRDEAERRHGRGENGAAIRAISSAIENAPSNPEVARLVGYSLSSWGANAEAADLFLSVLEQRPYEPQSYRDLALVLWTQRPSLTALLYEAITAGEWDQRFRGVQQIAREEYALFARAWQRRAPRTPLAAFLSERMQRLGLSIPEADLRVTMTWNTDNTDIDLWVTDPEGEECYYGHRQTRSGGELLDDVTQGFGPERFQARQAVEGEYRVVAKYYGNNGNRLVARTYVTLTVVKHVGTDRERIERHVISLRDRGDTAEVARIRF
ncbi:MAG: hypothetical protein H6721_00765 [Sandaracinus sp.]|nr:hypothetical protein [Sandaracinus sp.]MCB9630676.1 hypothetical protein [Sandaracinus sp.]